MSELLDRITINPEVCGGKPCVRGTRIWVSLILDFLADGMTEAELLAEYPQLVRDRVWSGSGARAHHTGSNRPDRVKLKLDENLGRRGLELLKASGHDATTVSEQGLSGVTDEKLLEVCSAEGRALVTLDRDFGQVTRFPPKRSAGIIVLDAGPRTTLQAILERLREFLAILETPLR
jgi:uncharacterized protein (DUF433 family)/predicted nuclease of predicted toxin-antitoxin system